MNCNDFLAISPNCNLKISVEIPWKISFGVQFVQHFWSFTWHIFFMFVIKIFLKDPFFYEHFKLEGKFKRVNYLYLSKIWWWRFLKILAIFQSVIWLQLYIIINYFYHLYFPISALVWISPVKSSIVSVKEINFMK